MQVKLLVLVFALCFGVALAQGQRAAHAAKLTRAEIEKVIQLVSEDKTKTQFYCELAEINEQMGRARPNSADVERLENRADELEERIGPEFVKFMDALDEVDESSSDGKELMDAVDKLDGLCPKN